LKILVVECTVGWSDVCLELKGVEIASFKRYPTLQMNLSENFFTSNRYHHNLIL